MTISETEQDQQPLAVPTSRKSWRKSLKRQTNYPYCLQGFSEYPAEPFVGMTIRRKRRPAKRTLIDWFAGQIPDPETRLRFLRTAMKPPRLSHKCRFLVLIAAVSLLFTAPDLAPQVRAGNAIPTLPAAPRSSPATVRVEQSPQVWQVDKTDSFETYSNGLRIENRFSTANRKRSYLVFSASRPDDVEGQRRSAPAGIVFHTTESLQAPFEPGQNSRLERIGESLLAYVSQKRSYNFLIDRFGRVYRIVRESDAANHAGYSIWSDAEWLYLNLNQSFIGVSFETETQPGQEEASVNPAQLRSAAMLTEMLRARYGISPGNCVTHAQVSVNASNARIGYHLDWASSFPFDQLGLPYNYGLPLPAISLFGFEYDSNFTHRAGARLSEEAQLGEQVLRDRATAAHLQVPEYRSILQKRYRSQLAVVRQDDASRMDGDEE